MHCITSCMLLHKLHHYQYHYGIRGEVNRWIGSCLINRRQAVIMEQFCSDFVSVKSGVPQGSVLGPCLYLVYINDLPERLTLLARLFADDTAVYRAVMSYLDQSQLQQNLLWLAEWEENWDMAFHPGKCIRLPRVPVTRSRTVLDFDYELHKQTLATVMSAKYLGITVQKEITWDNHIDTITAKANRTLRFLRRSLKISSIELREKAYLWETPTWVCQFCMGFPHQEKHRQDRSHPKKSSLLCTQPLFTTCAMLDRLDWPTL